MSKVVAVEHLTLDGVMQAPGRPDEDVRGGFEHGGWGAPFVDEVLGTEMGKRMARPGQLLLGRRTYQDLAGYWPHRSDNPYTEVLNKKQKYVASQTLAEPLPWQNSTVLKGDVVDAVAGLKAESDEDIGVLGSGELLRTLMRHGLVDEYLLLIYPLVLGSGRRLFADGVTVDALNLVDSVTTTTGVVIATYRAGTSTGPSR